MNLNIAGRRALVCGGSKGLGRAAALALSREGVEVTIVARTPEALEAAAREIGGETGEPVHTVAADVTTAEGRAAAHRRLPRAGHPRHQSRRAPDARRLPHAHARRLAPLARRAFLLRRRAHLRADAGHGRAPLRARREHFRQLHQIPAGEFRPQPRGAAGARRRHRLDRARAHPAQCHDQHASAPASSTPRRCRPTCTAMPRAATRPTRRSSTTASAAAPAGRFADPQECGDLIAFLCAAQSGFMTGQNIVNDGGVYQGLF